MREAVDCSKAQLPASLVLTQRDSSLSISPQTFADPSGIATKLYIVFLLLLT